MGSLKAALKAFFPNNNGDTNFSSSCLVPYFDSSQNPKGCVTPSKLASVLGESNGISVSSSDNANNMLSPGLIYRWGGSEPVNVPSAYASLIGYKTGTTSYVQYCFSRLIPNATYKRARADNGSWGNWCIMYDSGMLNTSDIMSPLASALKPYLDAL